MKYFLILLIIISGNIFSQSIDVENGMTPNQVNTTINANIKYHQNIFGINFADTLLVTDSFPVYITKLNWNLDTINDLCNGTEDSLQHYTKGITLRNGINSKFDSFVLYDEYLNYQNSLKASVTYTAAIVNDTILLRITSGKVIKISWGNGEYTEITGTGGLQTVITPYTVTPSVNQIRITGDIDEIQSYKQTNNKKIYYQYNSFQYLTSLDSLYLKTTTAWSSGTGDLTCPSLTYLYDYKCRITGTISDALFPNLIYFYSYAVQSYLDANLETLPSGLTHIYYYAKSGHEANSIDYLPEGLILFAVTAMTFTGDFDNAPETLSQIDIQNNDLQFVLDIENLPNALFHICMGYINAEWVGSINNLTNFPNLTQFDIRGGTGGDAITGNIDSLSADFLLFAIWDIPTSTIHGTLAGYPRNIGILVINNCGDGVTGGIEDVSVKTSWFTMVNNSSFTYDGGILPEFIRINRFIIDNSWTTELVDAFLINLANTSVLPGLSSAVINLSGTNQARSSASNDAVTNLQGRGFTITTTE